jgi:hypothetical protein
MSAALTAADAYRSIAAAAGRTLRIATRWDTVHEFIAGFRRLVSEHDFVVPMTAPRTRGATLRFSVRLTTGAPVFEGVGRIAEVYGGSSEAPGPVKIEIVMLAEESHTMHLCLLMAGAPTPASPDAARLLAADLQRRMRDTVPISPHLVAQIMRPKAARPDVAALGSGQRPTAFPRATIPLELDRVGRPRTTGHPPGVVPTQALDYVVEGRLHEEPRPEPTSVSGEIADRSGPAPLPVARILLAVVLAALLAFLMAYPA